MSADEHTLVDASELRAGIDIGTNTILMVIGHSMPDGSWIVVRDEHAIARLGEGLGVTGRISEDAATRGSHILTQYRAILDDLRVTNIRAVATSAMRDASNAADVRASFEALVRTTIDIIDGDEEARLTFLGTVGSSSAPSMVLDIGGGSTELAVGSGGTVIDAASVQVGVVRMTERYLRVKPALPSAIASARMDISQAFAAISRPTFTGVLHAVAGTPVALAALELGLADYDRQALDGHVLTIAAVARHADVLTCMSVDELLALPGMHPRRADLLPAGTLILHEAMRMLDVSTCVVSIRGLRYGVMMSTLH